MSQRDFHAERADIAYKAWLTSLVGVFALALESPNPALRQTRMRYLAQAKALGADLIDRVRRQVREIEADRDQILDVDQLLEQVKAQVMRDIGVGLESLRQLAVEIDLGVRTASFTTALLRARRDRVGSLRFRYVDRAGRAWSSANYVRTLVRQTVVTVETTAALQAIADAGGDLAMLDYGDPAHDGHGTIFSITGATPGYVTYRALLDQGVFHPNTNVQVKAA